MVSRVLAQRRGRLREHRCLHLVKAPSRFWCGRPRGLAAAPRCRGSAGEQPPGPAVYDEAVANYRKTTLVAYQEVEDSLVALHRLAEECGGWRAATSAKKSAYHADQRYAAGVADYLELTTTHTAALQAERDALSARVAQFQAAIALVRATGGGWAR